MRQARTTLHFATHGQQLRDITAESVHWLDEQEISDGLMTLFIPHTSASLTIQENADPDVLADLQAFFSTLVREDSRLYRHSAEGADDMPAHIRSVLTQSSLSIPIIEGRLALGTWQGIYLFEHRTIPHRRRVILHAIGA